MHEDYLHEGMLEWVNYGPVYTFERRQGDPNNPYFFVLCMEKLSHLISWEVQHKRWKPLRMRRNGPPISHLFFADDLILFYEVSLEQMEEVKRVMMDLVKFRDIGSMCRKRELLFLGMCMSTELWNCVGPWGLV